MAMVFTSLLLRIGSLAKMSRVNKVNKGKQGATILPKLFHPGASRSWGRPLIRSSGA
jgi:hypothetical protein